ncbi:ankyrin repeat and PH [Datura stramonium]|uniref:Ankyrin repeat and PH n=1 Tax=Datura stramonium TaxID=4076 RepID=A0ABS8SG17_DATST|nr:ankyrin repeat and PH [Datura stramonium]
MGLGFVTLGEGVTVLTSGVAFSDGPQQLAYCQHTLLDVLARCLKDIRKVDMFDFSGNLVLAYSQKARESSMYEQAALNERMHDYKRKIDQERRRSFTGSPNGDVTQPFSRSSHKLIEAVMQSAAEGKESTNNKTRIPVKAALSNIRGDWKRRFLFCDNRGMLYYYRKQLSRPVCLQSLLFEALGNVFEFCLGYCCSKKTLQADEIPMR